MSDGMNCTCAAHSESECGCGADWTPQEVINLRQQLADSQKQVTLLRDALTKSRRELDSCQKVIWLASDYGFDPAYVKGAQASIRKTDEALTATEPKEQGK